MIGFLSGRVLEGNGGHLLVAVGGEGGSVGYAVHVPQIAAYESILVGEKVELFIYTHVREDSLDLFGFATRMEKQLFMTLLSVNGIGPKSALGILSNADPKDLVQAIINKDKSFLTQVPGIGKKTAERVVLELSDSVAKKFKAWSGEHLPVSTASTPRGAEVRGRSVRDDALSALLDLGLRESDASALLNRALLQGAGTAVSRVEDLVKLALQEMSHGLR